MLFFFNNKVKIINEMPEKLLTRGGIFAINRPKIDPQLFFYSRIITGQAVIILGKKKILYFGRECKGKYIKIISNLRFYYTDTRKQLYNCCNIGGVNYYSAVDNY